MAYVKGKRERNKAANRAAILEAARHCFTRHDFDAITVRDIIRATDLATGTFYNYFPDKRSVFSALLEEHMSGLTARLTHIRRNARDIREFVQDTYLATFETVAENPVFYEVILRNPSIVRELYNDSIMGISVPALEDDIRDAIERGVFPRVDVEYMAAAFFGVAFEIGRNLAQREHRDPKPAAELATRLLLEGVGGITKHAA